MLNPKALLLAVAVVLAMLGGLAILATSAEPPTISCVEGYQVRHNAGGNNLVRGPDGHAIKC